MRKINTVIILTFLLLFAAPSLFGQSAGELNKAGFALYEQKRYEEALGYFEVAAETDPTYAPAHYNYACTAAILLHDSFCSYRALIPALFSHLAQSVSQQPDYRQKMMTDPDLQSVRNRVEFLRLAGYNPKTVSGLKYILTHVTWYGPSHGIFPASPVIVFQSDGTLDYSVFCAAGEEAGYYSMSGTWTVSGETVIIKIKGFDGEIIYDFKAVLDVNQLRFLGGDIEPLQDFNDICGNQ